MAVITEWNIDPNLQWFVRISGGSVTLYLSESDAISDTNSVASSFADSEDKVDFGSDVEFAHIGKTYKLDFYDDKVPYHMKIEPVGNNIFRIGPFFEIESEEHAIYKNSDIAGSRALLLINQHTHIQKVYSLTVPGFKIYELFDPVSVSSNRTIPNLFQGKIESVSYEMTRDRVVSIVGIYKYERMSR